MSRSPGVRLAAAQHHGALPHADGSLGLAYRHLVRRDLGELVDGHRVIARGLELRGAGAVLHYEFLPGIDTDEQERKGPFFWYWSLYAADDRGTKYDDSNTGGFDTRGSPSVHGERDIGGRVPRRATRLRIAFEPSEGWTPPEPWRRVIVVDLVKREVVKDDVL